MRSTCLRASSLKDGGRAGRSPSDRTPATQAAAASRPPSGAPVARRSFVTVRAGSGPAHPRDLPARVFPRVRGQRRINFAQQISDLRDDPGQDTDFDGFHVDHEGDGVVRGGPSLPLPPGRLHAGNRLDCTLPRAR